MNVPVKKGALLRHQGHLYFVEELIEHHSGQMKPAYHVTLRDVLGSRRIDRTLDELQPIEEVAGAYRTMQYLYAKGPAHVFMDSQSFEEIELPPALCADFAPFLKEGEEFRVFFAGEQPLKLDIPDSVPLKVTNTAAPSHAVGSAGNIMKEATLENGLEIHVPLFIKIGDTIRVDTRTRQYQGKVQA